jgi:hypothetical protein
VADDGAARCGPGRRCAPSASPFARRPKSCGPSKSGLLFRMADRPTKVPRRRRRQVSTVAGESTKQADKTTACGTPDVSGAFVVTNSCAFHFAHEAADAPCVRRSARPLERQGEAFPLKLGRSAPRDREAVSSPRHPRRCYHRAAIVML